MSTELSPKEKGLLKVSEVAKAAGVSPSTVKYYVKEGLVEIACKTGRNMAYYTPSCIGRVRYIKRLQTEKFYPLSLIKNLLDGQLADGGDADGQDLALIDAIYKTDRLDDVNIPFSRAIASSGLSRHKAELLLKAGIIDPKKSGSSLAVSKNDLKIMSLAHAREKAGIPIEQTVQAFSSYERNMRLAVEEDISALVEKAFLTSHPDSSSFTALIHVSDETLDDFVRVKRYDLNREVGLNYVEKLGRFVSGLKELTPLLDELAPKRRTTGKTERAWNEALECRSSDFAHRLSVISKSHTAICGTPASASLRERCIAFAWSLTVPEEFCRSRNIPAWTEKFKETGEGKRITAFENEGESFT